MDPDRERKRTTFFIVVNASLEKKPPTVTLVKLIFPLT